MTPLAWAWTVANPLIDGLLFLGLLLHGAPARVGLGRLAIALGCAAIAFVAKAVELGELVHNGFFAVRLAYVELVVLVPLAACVVLVAARRRRVAPSVRALAWLGLVPAPIGVWGTFVEPYRLVEERVDVLVEPHVAPPEPLRIAVLSDMQSVDVDTHLERAVGTALAFEPQLIFVPGDLIQRRDAPAGVAERFHDLLMPLTAPLGSYFVLGNADNVPLVRRALAGTPLVVLENQVVTVDFHGRRIAIGGARPRRGDADTRAFVAEFDRRREEELRLLIAHYPDMLAPLRGEPGVHLTVSGHTHGGQVCFPFLGPRLGLAQVPLEVAAGGLHEIGGRPIYVSRGVGCERAFAPTVRFLCPPEVSLLAVRTR
jgi:predicted MPP superfamily phosphohydrolase